MKKIDDKFEEYMTAFLLAVMCFLIFFQVVSRFVLNAPLAWSEETARYIFIWIIYFSASLAVKKREHIRVEVGLMLLKGKARKVAELFSDILFLVFACFLTKDGMFLAGKLAEHKQYSPAVGYPMHIVYMVIPLAYGMIIFRLLQNITKDLRVLLVKKGEEVRGEVL
jgi:TRAP-type C4-dicarboxylate transport system permease small subunit